MTPSTMPRLVAGIGLLVYAGAIGAFALYAGPDVAGASVILAAVWEFGDFA